MAEFVRRPISLLEVLQKSAGFDGALLTTYTAYLPFVEEVVVRRLRASGCNYAVALMDAGQLAEELSVSARRPASAGKRYGLLPVGCGGVFHPKLALLIGPKAARILIGSHNLTMSGFIHNREITNQIDVKGPKDREGAAALLEVLSFCRAWAGNLPEVLQEVLDPLEAFGRLYRGPVPDEGDLVAVGSRPEGASLWERVRPHLPESAKRVAFLGPFYDDQLSFVGRVMKDLAPSHAVAGLDPATARFPGSLRQIPRRLRVTDIHDLDPGHKGRGYLHGKAILIEAKSTSYLVTGSANPTAAAWLKPPAGRNAELVVVRRLPARGGDDLGLSALWDAPEVASGALSKLRARSEREASGSLVQAPLLGIRQGTAIRVDGEFTKVKDVRVLGPNGKLIPAEWSKASAGLVIDAGDQIDEASTIEILLPGTTRVGFVHHGALLRDEAAPSSQRRLREAIGGLSGDPTQLEGLLKLVDRVIFEAPSADRTIGKPAAKPATSGKGALTESTAGLVKTIDKRREAERHRLSSGDIGLLMDYLMRKLWRSISHEQATGARSEVELIDSDDDEVETHEFSDRDIAEAWHKKSRTLLKRLERRILEASDAPQVVMETAAVLGVLEALRRIEEQDRWKSLRLEFVDRGQADDFVMVALPRLLQPEVGLLDLAKREVGTSFAEEQPLIEWLTWLAWLTGFGPTDAWEVADPDDELDEEYEVPTEIADRLARGCLVGARLQLVDSHRVFGLLEATPFPGINPRSWLRALEKLGETWSNPAGAPRLVRAPALGDLVMTDRGTGPFVVHRVRADKADVIDFGREEDMVTFKLASLRVLDAGLERVRRAVG